MKIICIGRNYVDHAKELNNPLPKEPMVFMKPSTSLLIHNEDFYHPDFSENIHYEGEIVLKIKKPGKSIQPQFARSYYDEIAFGIDFTARDLQDRLKGQGHPWEIAKAFDHSAAVSEFIPIGDTPTEEIRFSTRLNGHLVQDGYTKDMIFDFDTIISYVSRFFKLQTGDYIFTGTPAGVGKIAIGDVLQGYIGDQHLLTCAIR